MWMIALEWFKSNKLSTGLIVVVVALGVALVFSGLHVKFLQAQNSILEAQNEAKAVVITKLKAMGDQQAQRLKLAMKDITTQKRRAKEARAALAQVPVPLGCDDAVEWGSKEINKILEGAR